MAARSLPVWDIYLTKQEAVEDTPSRKDGMLKPVEANHRRSYVQLITSVCAKFKTYGGSTFTLVFSPSSCLFPPSFFVLSLRPAIESYCTHIIALHLPLLVYKLSSCMYSSAFFSLSRCSAIGQPRLVHCLFLGQLCDSCAWRGCLTTPPTATRKYL